MVSFSSKYFVKLYVYIYLLKLFFSFSEIMYYKVCLLTVEKFYVF